MMTKQTEALKMAIEVLWSVEEYDETGVNIAKKAINACKDALEQPAQEPIYIIGEGWKCDKFPKEGTKLYTHPAPAWQGLSDDELSKLFAKCGWVEEGDNLRELGFYRHARMLEKALKEKNG